MKPTRVSYKGTDSSLSFIQWKLAQNIAWDMASNLASARVRLLPAHYHSALPGSSLILSDVPT